MWQPKMRDFLRAPQVCALVLIVDCRRGIGEMDGEMLQVCESVPEVIIALTKADKLPRAKLLAAEAKATETAPGNAKVIPVSSQTGANIATLRTLLTKASA